MASRSSLQLKALSSTVLLVVGALIVGDALNGSVVTARYPITSPAAVIRFVGGAIMIYLGYRFKTPLEEYIATPSETENEDVEEPEGEFDPELSPIGGDAPRGADEDDSSDR